MKNLGFSLVMLCLASGSVPADSRRNLRTKDIPFRQEAITKHKGKELTVLKELLCSITKTAAVLTTPCSNKVTLQCKVKSVCLPPWIIRSLPNSLVIRKSTVCPDPQPQGPTFTCRRPCLLPASSPVRCDELVQAMFPTVSESRGRGITIFRVR